MRLKMEIGKTNRLFDISSFEDYYGEKCSLQKSSLADENCIWLGIDNVTLKIMARKVKKGGAGWVDYPVHPDVSTVARMHLTQDMVKDLLPALQRFAETGELY